MSTEITSNQLEIRSATTGEKSVSMPLGTGLWRLEQASINVATTYPTKCQLSVRVEKAAGEYQYYHIMAGWAKNNDPLCLSSPRYIQGPATLFAIAVLVSASDVGYMQIALRRVLE